MWVLCRLFMFIGSPFRLTVNMKNRREHIEVSRLSVCSRASPERVGYGRIWGSVAFEGVVDGIAAEKKEEAENYGHCHDVLGRG